MREAQELANTLEQNLTIRHPEAASISGVAVETFSELLNNAAEHGMNDAGAHCHVRVMPHRFGNCLDIVVADSGPGIRATLAQNPNLPPTQSDQEAITLAIVNADENVTHVRRSGIDPPPFVLRDRRLSIDPPARPPRCVASQN